MEKITLIYTNEFGDTTEVSWQSKNLDRDDIIYWIDNSALVGIGFSARKKEND